MLMKMQPKDPNERELVNAVWRDQFRVGDQMSIGRFRKITLLLKVTLCIWMGWESDPMKSDLEFGYSLGDGNLELEVAVTRSRDTRTEWGEGREWETLVMLNSIWRGWWYSYRVDSYP